MNEYKIVQQPTGMVFFANGETHQEAMRNFEKFYVDHNLIDEVVNTTIGANLAKWEVLHGPMQGTYAIVFPQEDVYDEMLLNDAIKELEIIQASFEGYDESNDSLVDFIEKVNTLNDQLYRDVDEFCDNFKRQYSEIDNELSELKKEIQSIALDIVKKPEYMKEAIQKLKDLT